ncbi:putative short-chain dehydrogenase [Xylariaceae sp. FL1651]|nr:putative short-chain dehydrogenase [Xylariaceae sp. FL1651]
MPNFFWSQLFITPPYPNGNYEGKTIIITGSNTGLGKEAARHYIRMGAGSLILAVRSLDKGHAAKADLEETTRCAPDIIQVWQLDMASYASVQLFADRVNKELDRVDIFNANAGLARGYYTTSEDNETMVTVNFISTFLLAALVMPKLKETAARHRTRPTFCITGSGAHRTTKFPQKTAPEGKLLATVNDRAFFEAHAHDQYPVSKLLGVLALRRFAEEYPANKYPVTVNIADPGLCHSELAREANSLGFWLFRQVLARTTEVGSRTIVHGGSAGAETHGQYLGDCTVQPPSDLCLGLEGEELSRRVWSELEVKLEAIKPGVMKNF